MLKLQVIGNIGQDARISDVNGRKAINFSVAHNEKFTDAKGQKVERTVWVSCSMWRESSQSLEVAKYLTAGTRVYVEGRPGIQLYRDKANNQAAAITLNVGMLELVGGQKQDNAAPSGQQTQAAAPHNDAPFPTGDDFYGNQEKDDLPF